MSNIFLWGPSGSGKTWLLNSFIRKINLLRTVFKDEENSLYDIWVEDETRARLNVTELIREPTQSIDYRTVVYRRSIVHPEYNNDLFMNYHSIGMLDGPGDETTGQIEKNSNTPENRGRVAQARAALIESDYLFVIVHPGKYTHEPDQDTDDKKNPDAAGEHFLDRLNALLDLERKPGQRVLLCFTQSDQYGGGLGGLSAALAYLFGPRGKDINVRLRELYPSSIGSGIPIYYMSATGYYEDPTRDNKRISNYDQHGIKVLEETKWNPDKVLQPFFDVFDEIQENYLADQRIKSIPFLGKWLIDDRIKLYRRFSNKKMLEDGEPKIYQWLRR